MQTEIIQLETIDSTNKYALKLIESGSCSEGLVINAEEQSAGKGHGDSFWESEKGKNLTFSLVLQPGFIEPSNQFLITKIVSVSIRNVLSNYLSADLLKIKWPNDIYFKDQKLAGILIQNTISGQSLEYSVAGIGLNVNQEVFKSDAPNPVSMAKLTGLKYNRLILLEELIGEIFSVYIRSASSSFTERLNEIYLENLYWLNQTAKFKEQGKVFTGKIKGIGSYGRLQLEKENGKLQEYDFKEVEFCELVEGRV